MALTATTEATTIAKASQTITFAQPASPQAYQSAFGISPTASSGLSVAVVATGVCSYNGSLGTVTMTSGTGTCTLTASQSGDGNYNAATDVVRNVAASKLNQTITFSAPSGLTYGDPDATLGGSASSGLALSYSTSTPAKCSIVSGSKLHILAAGSCSVTASQGGDSNYNAATPVTDPTSIAKKPITVKADPQSKVYGSSDPALTY